MNRQQCFINLVFQFSLGVNLLRTCTLALFTISPAALLAPSLVRVSCDLPAFSQARKECVCVCQLKLATWNQTQVDFQLLKHIYIYVYKMLISSSTYFLQFMTVNILSVFFLCEFRFLKMCAQVVRGR